MEDYDIRKKAQEIVDRGNGYGVLCSDMLDVPEEYRSAVWREVVKIGNAEDNEGLDG